MFDIGRAPGQSHEAALQLAYDGRIPSETLRLARALDAAEAADRPAPLQDVAAALMPRRRDPGVVLAHMAQALIDGVALDQACTADDLRRIGFTQPEIERHIAAARTIANAAISRRVERFKPIATHSPARPRAKRRARITRPLDAGAAR